MENNYPQPVPRVIQKNGFRKFAIDRIEVHVNACRRVSKKRKVFDITKMRVKGTEAESFVLKKKPTLEIEVIKI